ncbi:MAG TPA: alpha/beta hydrolase [Candidatus Binataceae bacterium]|nr:alpha/beta hydrolase [Candidatus Binataceae bacterium]
MPIIQAGAIELNYETYGEGEPLLLIMGFGAPGAAWLPILPLLAGFKCIYFDNRGTGKSAQPADGYTIAQMAEDASNLLAALGIARAKVFGISMGGMIAQELTLRHPEQVEKVVLGCTTPGGPLAARPPDALVDQLMAGLDLATAENPDPALDLIMPLLFPEDFIVEHPELRSFMAAGFKMGEPTPRATLERTRAGVTDFDASDRLNQIKCPVLIVHGDKDVLTLPENVPIFQERIPHAEVVMVPNAGHSFAAVDPIGIHKRITDWLKNGTTEETAANLTEN